MTAKNNRPSNQAADISWGDAATLPADKGYATAAALLTGVHVVVVETPAGKYRRRVYFNLSSAQRAADRAVMAGHSVNVILCKLMPAAGGAE